MKTAPQQEYRDLEKLGYLCRWTLLTLAVLVVPAAIWAGLTGTMVVSSGQRTTMVLSDAVWRQGAPKPSLRGFFTRATRRSLSPRLIYQDPFGGIRFPWIDYSNNEVAPLFPAAPAGTHEVILRGIPYGSMAFDQHQATLRIVPGPETVYLMEAQLLADVVRSDRQTAFRIVKELSRLGQPVLVFAGQPELLNDILAELDQYSDIPRVFSLRKHRSDLLSVIQLTAKRLRNFEKTLKGDHRKPYVITRNVEVAIEAALREHYVHLIQTGNSPVGLSESIRLHASPVKLAEHLADERPAHLSIQE
ncbi:MAG: hypothetical protein QGG42_20055 [Phycisphaerae bacterium]|nr:hypothetical protein [Phycisphaerae bacterium]